MKVKNKKGFSLMELLVIIGIISIMTAVSVSALVSNKAQKEVEAAAREVSAAIREAQGYALTGKSTSGDNLCYTRFEITSSSNYALRFWSHVATPGILCPPITDAPSGNYYTKSLRNGVTITYPSSPFTLDFSVPFGAMSPSGTVRITLAKNGSHPRSICVYPPGRVDEKVGLTCP